MKKILIIVIALVLGFALPTEAYAQKSANDNVFTCGGEQMPEFPGGQAGLLTFICNNIQYPEDAANNNAQGKVYVKFVVTRIGKVENVQIARSSGNEALDQEALRVCRMLPDFIPGRENGKAVDVFYTVPVTFKLPADEKE